MTGFSHNSAVDEVQGEGKELNQSSELKKSNDPPDVSILESDDFDYSLSFSDSFLDFDSIRDWIEENNAEVYSMDDAKPDPGVVATERTEFGIVEKCIEMGEDTFCKEIMVQEKIGSDNMVDSIAGPDAVGSEKVEVRVLERQTDKVEDPIGVGPGNTGTLVCSINEEIVKISLEGEKGTGNPSLDGVSNGKLIENADIAAKSSGKVGMEGNDFGSEVVSGDEDDVKGGKMVVVLENGIDSGETRSTLDDSKIVDIISMNKNVVESEGAETDKYESDNSSLESSGSDDDSEEDEEEEEEEKTQEGGREERKRGKMDVEEGEIRESDVDEMVAFSDDEDDDDGEGNPAIRSKNELKVLPLVPPVNVTLEPYHQTQPVGVVLSIIGAQVIVEGMEKHNPLNEGSILWITERRSPLGLVDEIFGPVKNPYYIVRYNSESEVPTGIQQGTLISFVPEYANHVLHDQNLHKKGYDASGENDEEVPEEAEFSDDEKEAEYKRKLKMSKRGSNDQKLGNRKKDEKKFKNRDGHWKNKQRSLTGLPAGCQLPRAEEQHSAQPVLAQVDPGNFSTSLGPLQGFAGRQGPLPPFSQVAHSTCFVAPSNGVWQEGIPCPRPPNMGFPNGFPTNVMPLLQLNQPQQAYQMPLSGVPFQQHLSPNFALPAGQFNFSTGSPFPSPMCLDQIGFNQRQFVMGLQGQHTPSPLKTDGQGVASNVLPVENSSNLQPSSFIPGNVEASRSFSQGVRASRGRKPYHRGGGHFGAGSRRQQFNQ